MELEETIKKTLCLIKCPNFIGCFARNGGCQFCEDKTKEFLAAVKEAGYVQLAKDQTLPPEPKEKELTEDEKIAFSHYVAGYLNSQQDMLRDNFRRVIVLKEEVKP